MDKIVYILLFLLIRNNFLLPQAGWKGEIKEINGISTIINSSQPIYTTPIVTLKKVWQVGGEDPGFIMNVISAIDVRENGDVYVTDSSEKNVKVFSNSGELLLTFGKAGQGPGEFRSLNGIAILPDNRVLVIDHRIAYPMNRFNFFDNHGHFIDGFDFNLRSKSNQKNIDFYDRSSLLSQHKILYCNLFSKNSLLLFSYATENMKFSVKSIWIFDVLKKEASEIITVKKIEPRLANMKRLNDRMFLEVQYCHHYDQIYLIDDVYDYKIQIYNCQGKLMKVIRREFNLPLKTEADRKKDLKDIKEMEKIYNNKFIWEPLAENSIFFNLGSFTRNMFCDEKSQLWVLTNESFVVEKSKDILSSLFKTNSKQSTDEKSACLSFDVFSPEGKYLTKVPFQANQPRCFIYKNGFLYFADLGDDGFPWIYKFEIAKINN